MKFILVWQSTSGTEQGGIMKRKIIVKGMLIGMILLGAAGCGKGGEEEGSVNTSDITGVVDGNGE